MGLQLYFDHQLPWCSDFVANYHPTFLTIQTKWFLESSPTSKAAGWFILWQIPAKFVNMRRPGNGDPPYVNWHPIHQRHQVNISAENSSSLLKTCFKLQQHINLLMFYVHSEEWEWATSNRTKPSFSRFLTKKQQTWDDGHTNLIQI